VKTGGNDLVDRQRWIVIDTVLGSIITSKYCSVLLDMAATPLLVHSAVRSEANTMGSSSGVDGWMDRIDHETDNGVAA
jgi:hypothetical protein